LKRTHAKGSSAGYATIPIRKPLIGFLALSFALKAGTKAGKSEV
jgi:hypothetical protein